MAAAITHLAYSAVFTPSGGSAWNITDLVSIRESESGDVTELTTDNSQVVNGMFVNSIKGDIVITAKNLAHATDAGTPIGTVGSLVVKYGKRTAGKGFTASNYLSVTYANAMVRDVAKDAGVVGDGTFAVSFSAYGTDGTTVKSASVGA